MSFRACSRFFLCDIVFCGEVVVSFVACLLRRLAVSAHQGGLLGVWVEKSKIFAWASTQEVILLALWVEK